MNIFFDVELLQTETPNDLKIEHFKIMEKFRLTIEDSLLPIKHKIDNEEKTGKRAIMVLFVDKKIIPKNYSSELTAEIMTCLNKINQKEMWKNIDDELMGMMN